MENTCKDDDQIELPPGFRFHPTDEELITHYLSPKVLDSCFCARAIGEVDLNKCEPWDLPRRAKMGEKQWYFFCVRDRKYPTGLRTNRATDAGYWKATGKDKEIYKMKTLVGMKKTLVFYKGRAPKGVKTNWVMHEYRLEGNFSVYNLPKSAKNEWVISRVFQKSSGGKKIHISGLLTISSYGDHLGTSQLHPLTNSSFGESSHVTCFSNPMDNSMIEPFNTPQITPSMSYPNTIYASQIVPEYQDSALVEDQSILRYLLGNQNMKMNTKTEFSQESNDRNSGLSNHEMGQSGFHDLETPCTTSTAVPINIDCFWNY